jgi:hypothetical protein
MKPILSPIYLYLGRHINTSGFDKRPFKNVLIIDDIDIRTIVIMSMSQPSTSMAPSTGDDDTIDNVSMANP